MNLVWDYYIAKDCSTLFLFLWGPLAWGPKWSKHWSKLMLPTMVGGPQQWYPSSCHHAKFFALITHHEGYQFFLITRKSRKIDQITHHAKILITPSRQKICQITPSREKIPPITPSHKPLGGFMVGQRRKSLNFEGLKVLFQDPYFSNQILMEIHWKITGIFMAKN